MIRPTPGEATVAYGAQKRVKKSECIFGKVVTTEVWSIDPTLENYASGKNGN